MYWLFSLYKLISWQYEIKDLYLLINSTFIFESSIFSDPRMLLNLLKSESLSWVICKDICNEVSSFWRHELWKLQVNLFYSIISSLVIFCLEGRITNKELITENTQTPDIYFVIMRLVINHFRRQVIKCTTKSLSPIIRCMNTPSKISYLDCTLYELNLNW